MQKKFCIMQPGQSLERTFLSLLRFQDCRESLILGGSNVRKIGDVDEGVVEGGEDACDAEDELACSFHQYGCF